MLFLGNVVANIARIEMSHVVLVGAAKFSSSTTKNLWIEVNSQILNGIFTLIALCNFPVRLWMLYAWLRNSDSLTEVKGDVVTTV